MSQVSLGRPEFVPGTPSGHPDRQIPLCDFSFSVFFSLLNGTFSPLSRLRFLPCGFSLFRAHTKGSCNRTLLRRVLRRFFKRSAFLEGGSRRHFVRISVGTRVLRRVLRRGGGVIEGA